VVNRQSAPVLGAKLSPFLEKGEWQLAATYRTFRADKQYTGTRLNPVVTKLGTNVISELDFLDIGTTYALDNQWSLTLGIPVMIYGSSSRALPASVAGSPRFVHSAKGLGDITFVARRWVLDTAKYQKGNVALGLGIKLPTGNENAKDLFPAGNGQNLMVRPVDQSIQLGDGGWGVIFDMQAFQRVGSFTVFMQGSYLANPRARNGTLSPPALLNPNGPSAVPFELRYNTVPDQYLGRVGVTHPVPGISGLNLLLAARIEGSPQEDLWGETIGFRRPGYGIAIEPGIIYTLPGGKTTLAVSVPVTTQVNRQAVEGVPGDATFADYAVFASVTHRFGKSRRNSDQASAPRTRIVDARCTKCGQLHAPETASVETQPAAAEAETKAAATEPAADE
jgi:hypothetical protein